MIDCVLGKIIDATLLAPKFRENLRSSEGISREEMRRRKLGLFEREASHMW